MQARCRKWVSEVRQPEPQRQPRPEGRLKVKVISEGDACCVTDGRYLDPPNKLVRGSLNADKSVKAAGVTRAWGAPVAHAGREPRTNVGNARLCPVPAALCTLQTRLRARALSSPRQTRASMSAQHNST